jgi:hypothetical protein
MNTNVRSKDGVGIAVLGAYCRFTGNLTMDFLLDSIGDCRIKYEISVSYRSPLPLEEPHLTFLLLQGWAGILNVVLQAETVRYLLLDRSLKD